MLRYLSKEKLELREHNKAILLIDLDADKIGEEPTTYGMQMLCRLRICSALTSARKMLKTAYEDPCPITDEYLELRKPCIEANKMRFSEAAAEQNYMACRSILVASILMLDLEQRYDLEVLLQFNFND